MAQMQTIPLSGGTYISRAHSVASQKCQNMYPESVPESTGEGKSFVNFPTPGFKTIYSQNKKGVVRCLYTTGFGDLIAVIGPDVIHINRGGGSYYIGRIKDAITQVRMQDNGIVCFIVDGEYKNGWYFNIPSISSPDFGPIIKIGSDPSFYGSKTISILDQFMIFTQPNSRHWYVGPQDFSDWNTQPFDSLYIASKAGHPDEVLGTAVTGDTIWIFGRQTTETWFNSGSADFPFQRQPGTLGGQGCESAYSIATIAGNVLWLSRDLTGNCCVYMGTDGNVQKVSNFAIEDTLNDFDTVSDAIAHTYQQDGHQFYLLTIPISSVCLVFDLTTGLWHERSSLTSEGNDGRYRANAWASAYGKVYCGDFESGKVYEVSKKYPDEDGNPVRRSRSFIHIVTNGTRSVHWALMLDAQNGSGDSINIDWSDDRGQTYIDPISMNIGTNPDTWPTLYRLGITRDRLYRLTWVDSGVNIIPALIGIFLNIEPRST